MSEDWTQAEIVRSLQRIETSVRGVNDRIDGLTAGFVPRAEWQIWAQSRDREIADLKAARAPWWTWVTVITAVGAFLASVLPKILA